MDIRKLQSVIVDGLEDVKAQDIAVFNTEHLSPLFERVIIASGTSNRQTKALASSVRKAVKEAGFAVMRTEGEENGEWIIVDCAAAVVHIMQPAIRQYYQLEEIWGEKPVAIKTKKTRTSLVKASEPMDEEAPVKPKKASGKVTAAQKAATTAPTRKAAAKKAPAKKSAAKAEPVTEKKVAAKKVAAKKVTTKKVAAKKVVAKKAVVQKVVVNAPAKKKAPAAKKAAPKKVAVKKVAAKKVAAKKAPVRKTAR
ncbi:MAG: ribosome silencing factor [Aquabacterium sp.]